MEDFFGGRKNNIDEPIKLENEFSSFCIMHDHSPNEETRMSALNLKEIELYRLRVRACKLGNSLILEMI